jgi:hypothetical protein
VTTPEHTFCCSLCGSTNVECLHWVNPTSGAIESDNDDEARCNACQGIEKASELTTLAAQFSITEFEPYEVLRLVKRYHNTLDPEDQTRLVKAWSDEMSGFGEVEESFDADIKNDVGPGHLLRFLVHWFEFATDEAERNDPNPD